MIPDVFEISEARGKLVPWLTAFVMSALIVAATVSLLSLLSYTPSPAPQVSVSR